MKKLLLALSLCSLVLASGAAADDRVRIAYASRSIAAIMIFIANDKGFFKEEALEPQLILTRGTTGIAAAVAGDIEAIHIMGTAIRAIIQGLPLKALAVNQKVPLFWLVTRPELKTFKDLKGKIMAVTTIGGSQQLAVDTYRFSRPAFTRISIPTDKEVEEHLKSDASFLKLKEPVKSAAVFDFSLQREVNSELGIR
jgi:ABC-type nitrate/sulfonate/bicarbonate transport system substrate-binding protein